MGYDKKSIKAVKNQGGFDSSFDPEVLALDDQEKRELSRRIHDSGGDENEVAPDTLPMDNGDTVDVEARLSRLSFWERFLFLLQRLFLGTNARDYLKKVELNHIRSAVRSYRPSVFNVHSGRVTGRFGELLYALASRLSAFQRLYTTCQGAGLEGGQAAGGDEAGDVGFVEYFVNQLVPELPDLDTKLGYSYLRSNRTKFSEQKLRETLEQEVDAVLGRIPNEQRRMINQLYVNLLSYERLSAFNFYLLLRKFGHKYSRLEEGLPEFSAVPGGELLPDLKKLEDLVFSIDLTLDMRPALEIMEQYSRSLGGGESRSDNLPDIWKREDYPRIQEGIMALISEDRLSNLIRLISGNPYHMPQLRRRSVNLIEECRQSMLRRLLPRCQAILHQVNVDELNLKIKDLFGSDPLAEVEFYNEATNQRLSTMGFPLFTNCRHLQIIKTYHERLFAPLIKPALNVVVVDGDFFDKRLYNQLGDFFYKLTETYENSILEFERKVSRASKEGEKLQKLFSRYAGDVSSRKVVTEKVYYLNHLSAKAIRDIAELIHPAVAALDAIVKDALSRAKPDFVLNIKQLGGIRNRAIIKAIQKASDATRLVDSIIKEFL